MNINVETLTNIHTGVSARFDMVEIGPKKSSFTWKTIANLIQLHLGYYLPPNRLKLLLNLSIFSDVNIYRQFQAQATMLVYIYIHLGHKLSESSYLQFDDTSNNVIEMKKMVKSDFKLLELEKEKSNKQKDNYNISDNDPDDEKHKYKSKQDIIDLLENEFGRFFEKANGKGFQKKINTTCIAGRSQDDDPKSEIYFYRTHYGHAGNLTEKILEQRSPKNKDLILQGDLAIWNKPSPLLSRLFNIIFAGCMSHSRRPFKLYNEDDDNLCDQMLYYFLLLTEMENRIDQRGRTFKRTLFYRQKYGKKIWNKIFILAQNVLTAKKAEECMNHYLWPPSSKFGVACNYIINHFNELTVYLNNPKILPTNNKMERLLRPEKLMLDNSKFKGTEFGRICIDILRTIYMTCISADVPFDEYLKFVYKNRDIIEKEGAAKFIPYEFSKIFKKNTS